MLRADAEKSNPEPSLRVCVAGAGGLGLSLAAALCRAGASVTVLCRPTAGTILAERGRIEVTGAITAEVALAPSPVSPGEVALSAAPADAWSSEAVLVTVKGPDLPPLVDQLSGARPRNKERGTYLVGLQNGVVKDDVMVKAFGPDSVVGGATVLGCQRLEPGSAVVTGLGTTFLGEFGEETSERVVRLARALAAAGLPVRVERDIRSLLWTKFCHAIGVFGVSALSGLPSYEIFSRPCLAHAYRSLLEEAAAVAAAEGATIGDFPDLPVATNLHLPVAEAVAAMAARAGPKPVGRRGFSSMAQDLAAGRQTEVDETFGDLVRRAHRHGLALPCSELVYRVVKGRQDATVAEQ